MEEDVGRCVIGEELGANEVARARLTTMIYMHEKKPVECDPTSRGPANGVEGHQHSVDQHQHRRHG